MKNRKKTKQQLAEDRNALYHKVIIHNKELSRKNTELSNKINILENRYIAYEKIINKPKWWQFWKWFKN